MLQATGKKFTLDGKEIDIYSGSIHYFRVHPAQWEDRLLKLKACGFNAVETYIAWNLHEPQKGKFDFSGICDIEKFLRLSQKIGLWAIVRPGPYICAEWDGGGLPCWLLSNGCALRCSDEKYLSHVKEYFKILLPKLKKHLYGHGGNVIALQIENEYGSYGNDKEYLRFLQSLYREFEMDCLWFTSDGQSKTMLSGGTLPDVLKTVNFGSGTAEAFHALENFQPQRPKMCAEFWCGWFDWWGEPHHTRESESVIREVKAMFAENASFNFYMFCGGTNFGFTAGANYDEKYTATTTSYDYFAPLSESGDYTPVYFELRKLLTEKRGISPDPLPSAPEYQNIGEVKLTHFAALFDNLDNVGEKHFSPVPYCMESYGQSGGYILYRTYAEGDYDATQLFVRNVRDVAYVYMEGEKAASFARMDYGVFAERFDQAPVSVPEFKGRRRIDVLVEALGRVNYGEHMPDLKGISGIYLDRQQLMGFVTYTLPLNNIEKLEYSEKEKSCPAFLKGNFRAQTGKDCFVDFGGFTKGCIFVNEFNLGRYWNVGPQKTLYVPAPVLKKENEIVVFELEGYARPSIFLTDKASWEE